MLELKNSFEQLLSTGFGLELILDLILKSIIVVPITACIIFLLQRASSSTRHQVWLLAVLALLFAPMASQLLPSQMAAIVAQVDENGAYSELSTYLFKSTQYGISSNSQSAISSEDHLKNTNAQPMSGLNHPPSQIGVGKNSFGANTDSTTNTLSYFSSLITRIGLSKISFVTLLVWIVGMALVLARAGMGLFILWQRKRTAIRITDSHLLDLCDLTCRQLQVNHKVLLLQHPSVSIPMTWGFIHPIVLLPVSATHWTAEKQRMVLLHELAHVQRFDSLWQLVVVMTTALYWFNPLVWFAAKRLELEREHACDDAVLGVGILGSDYAEQLLDISTGGKRNIFVMCAGIAMARSCRLTGRLHAIVDEHRNRQQVSRRNTVMSLLVFAIILIPLSVVAQATVQTPNPTINETQQTLPLIPSNDPNTKTIVVSEKTKIDSNLSSATNNENSNRKKHQPNEAVTLTPSITVAENTQKKPAEPKQAKPDPPALRASRIYVADRDGNNLELLADITLLKDHTFLGSPSWSHDGNWIICDATSKGGFAKTHLVKLGVAGPDKGKVVDLGYGVCSSWSPDDTQLAFFLNSKNPLEKKAGLWVMDLDGTNQRRFGYALYPQWSPDGKSILTVNSHKTPRKYYLWNVESGKRQELLKNKIGLGLPTWSPDGKKFAATIQLDEMRALCVFDPVSESETQIELWKGKWNKGYEETWPDWSPDGKTIAFTAHGPNGVRIHLVSPTQGSKSETLNVAPGASIRDVAWSPDSKRIAFAVYGKPLSIPTEKD